MSEDREDRRTQILDVAQRIAETEGMEALTMRRLCSDLGLSAPIVYRLYANKAAIIAGLVDRLLNTEALQHAEGEPLAPWLKQTFEMVRTEQIKHPELLSLLSDTEALLDKSLELSETVLAGLRTAGLSPEQAAAAFQTLMAYTIGTVVIARGSAVNSAAVVGLLSKYPRVMEAGPLLAPESDEVFSRGLDAIIAGLPLQDR